MPLQRQNKGWYSRGYLPHFDSPDCIQHIVFRTFGSLPKHLTNELRGTVDQRRMIYDELLDQSNLDQIFAKAAAAEIMQSTLRYHDGQKYHLYGWCVMPNHVHALMECISGHRLGDIVKEWKSFSARQVNYDLNRTGQLWASDYFDRFIRNEEQFYQTLGYIEDNPVIAKLALKPELWRWSSARFRRD